MNQNPSTPVSFDGKCAISRLLRLGITNKTNGAFRLNVYFTAVASCDEDADTKSVVCHNTPGDEYAYMKSYTKEICGVCNTSCPPNHLISVFQKQEKGTTGIPAKFQKLRDLMDEVCLDFGDVPPPESLVQAVGQNTITGDELTQNIMEELKNLFPELKDVDFDCAAVDQSGVCNCGDSPISPSMRKYIG